MMAPPAMVDPVCPFGGDGEEGYGFLTLLSARRSGLCA
jgi:hypothetical protein